VSGSWIRKARTRWSGQGLQVTRSDWLCFWTLGEVSSSALTSSIDDIASNPQAEPQWPRNWYPSSAEAPPAPCARSRALNGGRSAFRGPRGATRSWSYVQSFSRRLPSNGFTDAARSTAIRPRTTPRSHSSSRSRMRSSSRRLSPATPRSTRRPPSCPCWILASASTASAASAS
jgi:hypothetical protein